MAKRNSVCISSAYSLCSNVHLYLSKLDPKVSLIRQYQILTKRKSGLISAFKAIEKDFLMKFVRI